MISAVKWVRRGAAAEFPLQEELTEEEIENLKKQFPEYESSLKSKTNDEDEGEEEQDEEMDDDEEVKAEKKKESKEQLQSRAQEAIKKAASVAVEIAGVSMDDDDLAEYNMDTYDDEPEAEIFGRGIGGLQYYESNEQDPHITNPDEESDDEIEDLVIQNTDNLLLVLKTEEEISRLEVHVWEDEDDNLFIHHDIMLPAFPLCVEWMNFGGGAGSNVDAGTTGNFCAVGTFQPEIEIWNLDVIDPTFPHAILGISSDPSLPENSSKKDRKKKKKKNKDKTSEESQTAPHEDAVLSIAWNSTHRHMLASGSADNTVKLWDLTQTTCIRTYTHHTGKVQVVEWNPEVRTALITGGYDRKVHAFDTRTPDQMATFDLSADVECLKWNPFQPPNFIVSTEDGMVTSFDVRNTSQRLFTLSAHDKATSSLEFNPVVPNMMVTGSYDKTVKVWNITDNKPSCVYSTKANVGKVFTAGFCPDSPYKLAVAGSKGKVEVLNVESVRRQMLATSTKN